MNNKKNSSFIQQAYKQEYKSFSPLLINRLFEWKDKQINIQLEATMLELGELKSVVKYVGHAEELKPMFIAYEAIASNNMEGIPTKIQQAFLPNISTSIKQQRAQKFLDNYIESINWGVKELEKFPLSFRLIKETHKILYKDLPKQIESAGKLRFGKNIKHKMQFVEENNFIPPNKHELKILINDAKQFWRNENLELPQLIKIAISLYQFEIILPFLDGNGRTARTLLILEMLSLEFLEHPIFCLSTYFEKNRLEYYNRLNLIKSKNDIEQWIRFFLNGIKETANHCKQLILDIDLLKKDYQIKIKELLGKKRYPSASTLITVLLKTPYLSVTEISEKLHLSFQSSNQLTKELAEIGLIREISGVKRNRIFFLWEYIELFET